MRREAWGIPFFALTAAGALAAIVTSHPTGSDASWLIVGAVAGGDSAVRLARKHQQQQRASTTPPTDRKRVRAVATFAGGLGVFLNAVLPRQPWLAIFAYVGMASLIVAAYYGWFVATTRRR